MSSELDPGAVGSAPVSRFAGNLLDILDRVEYSRVRMDVTDNPVYRLRYEAYRREEFVPVNDAGIVTDDLDGQPNAMCFGVLIDGELVSSDPHPPRDGRASLRAEHEKLPGYHRAPACPGPTFHRSEPVHRRLRGVARLSCPAVPDAAYRGDGHGLLHHDGMSRAGAPRTRGLLPAGVWRSRDERCSPLSRV